MPVSSTSTPLGSPAPDFSLRSVDGEKISLRDFHGTPALLVAFLCNHCPYVRHIEAKLGQVAGDLFDLDVVAVCSNDTAAYPDDDLEGLRAQHTRASWHFPYLMDKTQDIARQYGAECTPDFFLYGRDRRLAYHGAFDASTPGNGLPATGELLRNAAELVIQGHQVPQPHRPSMGCSIKWRSPGASTERGG